MADLSMASREHPVVVRARLDEPLSRWLWLVKWLLLIPHYIVLFFLWIAFFVVTVVAFVAVLITGRYPRALFDFNLGVIRWSWRVDYYGYGGLGTDRYPPFTLSAAPDYPATVDIAYPERLSRGLVLVKWWLLALPHYLILAVLTGGLTWTVYETSEEGSRWNGPGGGLIILCVLFAAIGLLFTTRYPRGLYDLVVGLDRWVLRVVAYAALMTDAYPPFRLDQGGAEPASPEGPPAPGWPAHATVPEPTYQPPGSPAAPGPPGTPGGAPFQYQAGRSVAGPVVALVLGLLVFVTGAGLAALGGGGLWLDGRRDAAGFVSSPDRRLATDTAAITVEDVDLRVDRTVGDWAEDELGRIRVRATADDGRPLFVGIGPQAAVDAWLTGVAHDQVYDFGDEGSVRYRRTDGTAPMSPPGEQQFWVTRASGSGTQEVTWALRNGQWALVIARADGSPGVQAETDVGARLPDLRGLAIGLLIAGLLLLVLGGVLVALGAAGLGRRTRGPSGPSGPAGQPAYPAPGPPGPAETGARERPAPTEPPPAMRT